MKMDILKTDSLDVQNQQELPPCQWVADEMGERLCDQVGQLFDLRIVHHLKQLLNI